MKPRTVLSLEQALALPYATMRFVHLGWRVIRLEATGTGQGLPGDPNRYIGANVVDDDRRTYFIAPNVGKDAIALNLKHPEGRETLKTLIRELDVDLFCCNTLPARFASLGIDYDTLRAVKPDLIWGSISAMGPGYPQTPGYDPAIQAMAGIMEMTGPADGPPTLAGVPLVDLKAGDELYAAVCLALAERAETGNGQAIYISMLQAAASWLINTLPLLDFDCEPAEVTRCGNEHRLFVPTNVYPCSDGHVFLVIGNDLQWERLCAIPFLASLANEVRRTNDGRHGQRQAIHAEIAAITKTRTTAELTAALGEAVIPHALINTVRQVRKLEAIADKLTTTRRPDGRLVRMQPMATDVPGAKREYSFPPSYGQHTQSVLAEAGIAGQAFEQLQRAGVVPA